jgi:hypothetical protein
MIRGLLKPYRRIAELERQLKAMGWQDYPRNRPPKDDLYLIEFRAEALNLSEYPVAFAYYIDHRWLNSSLCGRPLKGGKVIKRWRFIDLHDQEAP